MRVFWASTDTVTEAQAVNQVAGTDNAFLPGGFVRAAGADCYCDGDVAAGRRPEQL